MMDSIDRCDRKPISCRLVYPVRGLYGHTDGGQGCVVTEGEPVGVSGLPMSKTCVLFGIPINEIDLES